MINRRWEGQNAYASSVSQRGRQWKGRHDEVLIEEIKGLFWGVAVKSMSEASKSYSTWRQRM
jgi:hypothetical protein